MAQGTIKDFDEAERTGSLLLDDGTEIAIDATSLEGSEIRMLRLGQRVRFDVLDPEKRPVMADADSRPVRNVHWVEVRSEENVRHRILFDPGHGLEERLIREQFS